MQEQGLEANDSLHAAAPGSGAGGKVGLMDLWRRSADPFPGLSRNALVLRARYCREGLRNRDLVGQILHAAPASSLHRIMADRPRLLGALVWPYQCAGWDAPERLRRILSHYREIDRIGPPLTFEGDERLILARIGEGETEVTLILDQPPWLLREGGLTLNLFLGNFRAFTLSFSLARDGEDRIAVIAGLQGRNRDGVLDLYRALTKAMHGLRPRDFLIEAFRMLCRQIGVTRIEAVTDACRHHQHAFFGTDKTIHQDYDAIWEDRGGTRVGDCFFRLDVAPERRDLETVKANKRSMYRRRYAFIDDLEADFAARLPGIVPEPAIEAE